MIMRIEIKCLINDSKHPGSVSKQPADYYHLFINKCRCLTTFGTHGTSFTMWPYYLVGHHLEYYIPAQVGETNTSYRLGKVTLQ